MDIILKKTLESNDEEKIKVYPGEYELNLIVIQKINSDYERELFFFVTDNPIMEGVCLEYWMFHILKNMGIIEIKKY